MTYARKLLFLILLLGFVFTFTAGAPQPVEAATIVVDGTTCTLPDAILAANSGGTVGGCTGSAGADTIVLDADVTLSSADTTNSTQVSGTYAGLPDLTSEIIIQAGTGNLIERDSGLTCNSGDADQFRIFNVGGGMLTLDGITIQNGCAANLSGPSRGGAVYVSNGTLTLLNSTLTQNTAHGFNNSSGVGRPARGGAVYSFTSDVLIDNTTLSNNDALGGDSSATTSGEGQGGALFIWDGSLTIQSGSAFTSNTAVAGNGSSSDSGWGGAIHDNSTGSLTLSISNATFTDNTATGGNSSGPSFGGEGRGGAINLSLNVTSSSITNSTFSGNLAQGGLGVRGGDAYGGAVNQIRGSVNRVEFTNNTVTGGDGMTDNGGNAYGGGFYGSGDSTLFHILFSGNQALGGNSSGADGGTASGGGSYDTNGASNVMWINNTATGGVGIGNGGSAYGGGSYEVSAPTLDTMSFINNTASGGGSGSGTSGSAYGGGLYETSGLLAGGNMTFSGNQAAGGISTTSGTGGDAYGGGWYVNSTTNNIGHITLVDNEANGGTGTAGNGLAEGGGLYLNASFDVDNALIGNNTVTPGGGSLADNDCDMSGAFLTDVGYSLVEAPGSCLFDNVNNITGIEPLVEAPADNGCNSTLAGGSCFQTVALLPISEAIDAGNCAFSGAVLDQVATARPQDIGGLPNAGAGCDMGAFEYVGADYTNDAIVLFDPATQDTGVYDSVLDNPNEVLFTNTPPSSTAAEWVMGDWNGDGVRTPGIFDSGVFVYTNGNGGSSSWSDGMWLGNAPGRVKVVSGAFDAGFSNDCIAWVDSNTSPVTGDLRFSLKWWCDMSASGAVALNAQWLGAPLGDSGGFSGTHQWVYGDWDSDNLDEPAVRRGGRIARGSVAPSEGAATFGTGAQRWDTADGDGPGAHGLDDGIFVAGDWDGNGQDTWGTVYDDDTFYYRDDISAFNPGPFEFQSQMFTSSVSSPRQVDSHHLGIGGSGTPGPAAPTGLVASDTIGGFDTSRNVEAEISVGKSGNYQIGEVGLVGDSIVWTITVSNTGSAPATGVQITDNVPSELQIDDAIANNGTVAVSGQVVIFTVDSIGVGETVQLQVVTTILQQPTSGTFANSVNVLIPDGNGGGLDANLVASGTVESVDGLPATGYAPQFRW